MRIFNIHKIKKVAFLILLIKIIVLPSSLTYSQTEMEKQDLVVVSKKPTGEKPGTNFLDFKAGDGIISYQVKNGKDNKQVYVIQCNGKEFTIDALSYIAASLESNRIVVFGDSMNYHVNSKMYFRMYSESGTLIKASDLVVRWPYKTFLSEKGSFFVLGNTSAEGGPYTLSLIKFDKNGNKVFSKNLPSLIPNKIIASFNEENIGVVLYDPEKIQSQIYYFDQRGNILYVDNEKVAVSGIGFLSNNNVVITSDNYFYLYNLKNGYQLVHSGILTGPTIGEYPITAHHEKNYFVMVTLANPATNSGYMLSVYDSDNGSLIASRAFEGEPKWQTNRLAKIDQEGSIELLIDHQIVKLRLK